MSMVHAPHPRLVVRTHVDLCRRTAAACLRAAERRQADDALMPSA